MTTLPASASSPTSPAPEPAPTPSGGDAGPPPRRDALQRLAHAAERFALLGLMVAIALFFAVFPRSSGTFLTAGNINVVTGTQAAVALLALSALFPLVSGFFDFSVGATAATATVLCAGLMSRNHLPLGVAVAACVLLGALIGAVNGLVVTRFRMNSFVSTLGMATLLGGLIQWYTGGQTIITGISEKLTDFGSRTLFGLPEVVYVVLGAVLVAWYLLAHTPYGRALYAIGSNPRSARLVGLRVDRSVWFAFLIAGSLAGLVGVLQLARTGSATADTGTSLLFPALAAVFLGATTINPGHFNVFGTIVGVLFVSVSVSGLTLSGASAWASPVFNGAALLAAVGLSTYLGRRRGTGTMF
ncbi:MAG TPA: ABC transporter permease [Rugosimonospora sp.]|nr:ABC transporter permease [Rugosimonospora sp.]